MSEIIVHIPAQAAGGYPITIGTGILSGLLGRVEKLFPKKAIFIVTDENLVQAGHLATLTDGKNIPTYSITPAGEQSKTMATTTAILEAMEQHHLGRDTVVIGLGGGTVGDIAGFAAAVFKRGVPIVHIPTTTVAQADSSIGGKTGVDSSLSKNAFGCFWYPSAVFIDTATLKTLDDLQYRAGLVESVKHAATADAEYFAFLEKNSEAILRRDTIILEQIAGWNCRIKASVVEEDPTEKNKRRILNYGHTIGHAVESACDYRLLHGQCVAIGMMAAGMMEQSLGMVNDGRLERIEAILKKLGMPTKTGWHGQAEGLAVDDSKRLVERLMNLLSLDKKAVGKWPRFVLLERLGRVYCKDGQWAHEVSRNIVEECLGRLAEKAP
jgi:3-dehydroquinate synthase